MLYFKVIFNCITGPDNIGLQGNSPSIMLASHMLDNFKHGFINKVKFDNVFGENLTKPTETTYSVVSFKILVGH